MGRTPCTASLDPTTPNGRMHQTLRALPPPVPEDPDPLHNAWRETCGPRPPQASGGLRRDMSCVCRLHGPRFTPPSSDLSRLCGNLREVGPQDKMMLDCAKACRECAAMCREMAKDATGALAAEYTDQLRSSGCG